MYKIISSLCFYFVFIIMIFWSNFALNANRSIIINRLFLTYQQCLRFFYNRSSTIFHPKYFWITFNGIANQIDILYATIHFGLLWRALARANLVRQNNVITLRLIDLCTRRLNNKLEYFRYYNLQYLGYNFICK